MRYEIKILGKHDHTLARALSDSFQIEDGVKKPESASEGYLKKLLAREDFFMIVAISDGKVIGGLTAYELVKYKRAESEVYVYELGVEVPFQRKGIATALMKSLKEICREKGIKEIFLGALADNSQAIEFYKSLGGEAIKVIEFTFDTD